ncbi:outer membrane lipoprotein-sorting protein [candidate division KSB1 bacterium]|nr:outer membrane lipoprotein-sorting protein [candidate division KSB1 bacterium]
MKNILWILLLFTAGFPAQPDAVEILERIDNNKDAKNRVMQSKMVVHDRRATRTIVSKTWMRGREDAFTEYLAPAREKGTKMLKLGDQLWTYSPSSDRTIRISGHMLRQSVMGSDLSYEDMMQDPRLSNLYTPTVMGEETQLDRPCWKLELTAKQDDIAYARRIIWVDKERDVVLEEQRFAKSGKLLKTMQVHSVVRMDARWVIEHATFKDELKNGEGTEFYVDEIEFDADIPEYLFSKSGLRR